MSAPVPRPSRAVLRQSLAAATLPQPLPDTPDQTILTGWLSALAQLQGVPPQWLIPDSTMLPTESIRFFTLDPNWIAALLQGATAVASGGAAAALLPAIQSWLAAQATPAMPVSGFLLRSALLVAFPTLTITAADSSGADLTCLRYDLIDPTLALALFSGQIASVTIAQPSSGLTFGADPDTPATPTPPNTPKPLRAVLRYTGNGDTPGGQTGAFLALPQRPNPTIDLSSLGGTYNGPANRGGAVLDASALQKTLAASLTPCTSAEMALQLIQPTESAGFTLTVPVVPQ